MVRKGDKLVSKKTILTSGYFSLNRALMLLLGLDYKVVTPQNSRSYGGLGKDMPPNFIDESDMWFDVTQEELNKHGFSDMEEGNLRRSGRVQIASYISRLFGFGGRGLISGGHFITIAHHEMLSAISGVNAAYNFVKSTNKKHKYVAALLHGDSGIHGAMLVACRELNIPTFVCYNGAITECITSLPPNKHYTIADTYYLHGQYGLDWLADRYDTDKEIVVVGQPSFDSYYDGNNGEVIPNTFLYNSKVVFTKHLPEEPSSIECLVDSSQSSFLSHKLPPTMDRDFLMAFAKYQREINPEAKLIVSLRPYHSTSNTDFKNLVSKFGIKNSQVFDSLDRPLRKLLPTVEYVITCASTVAIEGLINRKSVVLLPGESNRFHPYRFVDEWTIRPENMSVDSIIASIDEVTKRKEELVSACDKYATYYNYKDDGRASERLVRDLVGRI